MFLLARSTRILVVTLCATASALALTACSGSSSTPAKAKHSISTPGANLVVKVGLTGVASAGTPTQITAADPDAVRGAVTAYTNAATLQPLLHPTADPDGKKLATLFTASAAGVVAGPERDSLADIGVGQATKPVTTTLVPVSLSALADKAGAIDLIGTTLDLNVATQTKLGPISIHRAGESRGQREWHSKSVGHADDNIADHVRRFEMFFSVRG